MDSRMSSPTELLVHRFCKEYSIHDIVQCILFIIISYIPNDWYLHISHQIIGFNIHRDINLKYYVECAKWNISNISSASKKLLFGPKLKLNKDNKYYKTYSCCLEIRKIGCGCFGFADNNNNDVCALLISPGLSFFQINIENMMNQTQINHVKLKTALVPGDTITVSIGLKEGFFGIKINNCSICRHKILKKSYKTLQLMIDLLQGMSIKLHRYEFTHVKTVSKS